MRNLAVAIALSATMLLALGLAGSATAATTGGCHLQGSASFSPRLNSSSQPFDYSFDRQLSLPVEYRRNSYRRPGRGREGLHRLDR